MNLKEKRKKELQLQKKQRKELVINEAINIINEKGINNTTVQEIANRAEIGVASVYRYFKTKNDLVIDAAIYLWEKQISLFMGEFEKESYTNLDGLNKVKKILSIYINIYHNHKDFLNFLEQFDNYIVKEKISVDKLNRYEKSILNIKSIMITALEQGKKDRSINKSIDNNAFYITVTHTLISLSQKLTLRGYILKNDNEVSDDTQLNLLIDMAINYIIS
jgi:AcrR family transcriptional regulator